MQIIAKTEEELINKSNNPELFLEIKEIIDVELNTKGKLITINNMTTIGYEVFHYKNTTYDGNLPLISIAPQKNNISVYVFALEDGQYLPEKYGQDFGNSNIGKSCIRIKKLNPLRVESLQKIVRKAIEQSKK